MKDLDHTLIEVKISGMGVDMRHRGMCKKSLILKNKGFSAQDISRRLSINSQLVGQVLL